MPLPKQRHTKSRRNRRRSHHALKEQILGVCLKCGQSVLPHHLCANCGSFKGREVIDVLKKLTKKERKAKEKEMEEAREQRGEAESLNMERLSAK
ncbi:MAG: 50S ribosomal protein L32 [Candidatus Portnoybacteria bacterium]|nr:50S ribosomal protein L32 [Candidatus Portnoybacteria bacterium]